MSLIERIPTSTVQPVDTPEKRRLVLEDLGYEPFDYELWNYWIFFEESSAERVFRDFLIPWFVPELKNKVRTFSAGSVCEIPTKFDDFNRLFVFLHLQETYRNRVWVVVDGGDNEKKILDELANKYEKGGWSREHFRQLTRHNFEEYYPQRFQNEVNTALSESNKQRKRDLKKRLLEEVIRFCQNDEETAKAEFRESANEAIVLLNDVAQKSNTDD
jgi:hypothetical protein